LLLLLLRLRLRLLPLLRGRRHARRHTDGDECKQSGPKLSHEFHGKPPDLSGFVGKCERNNPAGDCFVAEVSTLHG
jgi:hypothetical protein